MLVNQLKVWINNTLLMYLSIFWEYLYFTWVFIFHPTSNLLHFLIKMWYTKVFYSDTFPQSTFVTYYKIGRSQKNTDCKKVGLTNEWSGACKLGKNASVCFLYVYSLI